MRLGGSLPVSHHRLGPPRLPGAPPLNNYSRPRRHQMPPSRSARISRRLNNSSRSVPKPCSLSSSMPPFSATLPSSKSPAPRRLLSRLYLLCQARSSQSALSPLSGSLFLCQLSRLLYLHSRLTTFLKPQPLTATALSTQLLLTALQVHFF